MTDTILCVHCGKPIPVDASASGAEREAVLEEATRALRSVSYNGMYGTDIPRLHALMINTVVALKSSHAGAAEAVRACQFCGNTEPFGCRHWAR